MVAIESVKKGRVARELSPGGRRSRRRVFVSAKNLGAASPPGGSKPRRHKGVCLTLFLIQTGLCLSRCRIVRGRATLSCAVAYNCARIRRLVRLGPGLYRFRVTEDRKSTRLKSSH